MKSLRLHAPRDLRWHDEPIPQPGPGEVLIRMGSVAVCASDVHWYLDGRIGATMLAAPTVLGHEPSGTIEAVGEGVTKVVAGQRVAVEPAKPCRKCELCATGYYNVCPDVEFFGTFPVDGCFREYVAWPADLVVPIPDSISMDEAAMLEPLAIGVFANDLAAVKPGETVVILGAGAVGLSVLQPTKLAGASKILVSDPVKERRDTAIKLGADAACDPADVESVASEMTSGRGFDVVFECAGDMAAVRQTTTLARVMGRIAIIGIPEGDDYVFAASASRRKQLTVIFVRRSNNTLERAVELVRDGKVDVASFATHLFPLDRTEDALKLAESKADGVIRAVVRVS